MSTLILEGAPGQAVDRGDTAQAGSWRETACPGAGRAANPEVAAVAQRRRFSDQYKLKLLTEIDDNPGMSGVILRREGLYSSNLFRWRQWRDRMGTQQKPVSKNKRMHNEMATLQRENARLKMKLQKAEGLIELQKKTSELLELMSRNGNDES